MARQAVRTVRVKNISKEVRMPDFLAGHPNSFKRTEVLNIFLDRGDERRTFTICQSP